MRTTVTLDKDVEELLKKTMHRQRKSFKETLNDAVRAALRPSPSRGKRAAFEVKAKPLGLRPGIDPAGFNQLVDELEMEGLAERLKAQNK